MEGEKKVKFKSCFISAPVGTNLQSLRKALEERDIKWFDQSKFYFDESIKESIIEGIQSADFVCVVMPKGFDCSNIFFELGVATTKNKPVIAFVDPKVEQLPSLLQSFAYARLSMDDRKALALYLDSFLKHVSLQKKKKTSKKPHIAKPRDISWIREAMESIEHGNEQQFETFVIRLLEESGVIVSRQPLHRDKGVDLAVWIDSLQNLLGNPILVELKYGAFSNNRLSQAEDKLRHNVEKMGGLAGILIYFNQNHNEFPSQDNRWPLIIRLSLQELVKLVENGNLEKELTKQRNLAVHGGV